MQKKEKKTLNKRFQEKLENPLETVVFCMTDTP